MKTPTIDLKGKSYATVPARIKEFREDCPHGSIETKPTILDDGSIMFSTTIIKDLSDEFSARSTGTSLGKVNGDKAFEKLETISVGRALALLGYMASGDIASSEEMKEFYEYKNALKEKVIVLLQETSDLEELQKVWNGLTGEQKQDKEILKVKNDLKIKYTK